MYGSRGITPLTAANITLALTGVSGTGSVGSLGSGTGDASAPTIGTAIQFGPLAAAIHFTPPSSHGTTNISGYRTYIRQSGADVGSFDTSSVRLQDENNTGNWQQLNCRTEAKTLTGGGAYTFQVAAINTAGVSPNRSADSNSVTALSLASFYMAAGGGIAGLNTTQFGFFLGSAETQTNVAPGTASTTPITGFTAPTNPGNSTDNVIEVGITSGVNGSLWFPKCGHQALNGTFDTGQNGRFNTTPFTNLIFKIWPTQAGMSAFPNGFAACLWVNGVATSSATGTLTDSTQVAAFGNPGFPTNILVGSLLWNLTTGQSAGVSANTATTITAPGLVFTAGDYYEVSIADVGIGQALGAQAPTPMTANVWNTFVVPIANLNGGGTAYPNVVTFGQMLKMSIGFNAPSGNAVMYVCQQGMS